MLLCCQVEVPEYVIDDAAAADRSPESMHSGHVAMEPCWFLRWSEYISGASPGPGMQLLHLAVVNVVWEIWRARQARVFGKKSEREKR